MLAELVQVKFVKGQHSFVKGQHSLFYKCSFSAESFTEFAFLKKTYKCVKPGPMHSVPRGISSDKKKDILMKLCPLMPQKRRVFWKELPEYDAAEDLIEHK